MIKRMYVDNFRCLTNFEFKVGEDMERFSLFACMDDACRLKVEIENIND